MKNPQWSRKIENSGNSSVLKTFDLVKGWSKVARKSKSCSKLLVLKKVARNDKSCSKVAEYNLDMPIHSASYYHCDGVKHCRKIFCQVKKNGP